MTAEFLNLREREGRVGASCDEQALEQRVRGQKGDLLDLLVAGSLEELTHALDAVLGESYRILHSDNSEHTVLDHLHFGFFELAAGVQDERQTALEIHRQCTLLSSVSVKSTQRYRVFFSFCTF